MQAKPKDNGKIKPSTPSVDKALEYLAKMLVVAYFEQKAYAPAKQPTKQ